MGILPEAFSSFTVYGTNYLKQAFVNALRFGFANIPGFPNYVYSPNQAQNKIQIYRSFPRRMLNPPTIVVEAKPANVSLSYLGAHEFTNGIENTEGDPTVTVHNGNFIIPIKISVYALTTTDREKLIDLIMFFIRDLFRDNFHALGLAYKSIHLDGEAEDMWDKQVLYSNSITVDVYQEYTTNIPVALSQLIDKIDLTLEIGDESFTVDTSKAS